MEVLEIQGTWWLGQEIEDVRFHRVSESEFC